MRRTLINFYNQRPTWLDLAHRCLDEPVLDAYAWAHSISDAESYPSLPSTSAAPPEEETCLR